MSNAMERLEGFVLPRITHPGRGTDDALAARVVAALDAVSEIIVTRGGVDDATRGRAARAFFRCAAWEAMQGDETTEHGKCLLVRAAPPEARALVVRAWADSDDPHAPIVRALLDAGVDPVALAAAVELICHTWRLADPSMEPTFQDPPKCKDVREQLVATVASLPSLVFAVQSWWPTLTDDPHRRVAHAGSVLAVAGDTEGLRALRATLTGDDAARADEVWARCREAAQKAEAKRAKSAAPRKRRRGV